ncbi:conserved hypothetical protein [Gloeothece citriformis PCC 7424]|uniref:Zinc-ribbon domain-containing protein n=1 Tax=Gloeothece citriformis (strain PCC 7424) TaxID=65393 RepID=B7KBL1_GLOC7|nr:zinc ribbon domain-containing protein [Gloeothece citriformis]ACK72989.1 conserved hypothetical protein [Gloeothece citriformis PCC 7424]
MAYVCELGTGQRIYLDNPGNQTIITTSSSSPGQQQHSSSEFTSGHWTSPPQLFHTPNGILIKITGSNGEQLIQVQGNSIAVTNHTPTVTHSQPLHLEQVASIPASSMPPMQPLEPMPPMQPMTMGNMEMSLNPMQMRMGNMEMHINSDLSSHPTRRFCSQCGAKVKESDRFCASCGHQLS